MREVNKSDKSIRANRLKIGLMAGYFLLASIYITWPLVLNLDKLILGLGDELLIAWIMNWDIHTFLNKPFELFNANIFYPYKNTLAYSDLHLTSAILGMPILWILKEPVVVYNFTLIFALFSSGFFTYLLVWYLTKSHWAAVASGTLFSFSTIHLNYLSHPQMLSLQYIPLAFLFLVLYQRKKKKIYLGLSGVFFILQSLNSLLTMYFLLLIFAVFIIFHRRLMKSLVVMLICSILVISPFIWPYFQVSRQFHYQRDIRDTIHFSLQFEDFVQPTNFSRFKSFFMENLGAAKLGQGTASGYLGMALIILSFISLISYLKQTKTRRKKQGSIDSEQTKIFIIIALTSFVLSFGSALHLFRKTVHLPIPVFFQGKTFNLVIPLPYALFYYLLPGFAGFRTPSRWIVLTAFTLSVFSGILLAKWMKKKRRLIQWTTSFLIIFSVLWEFSFPLNFKSLPSKKDFPKVYHFLAKDTSSEAIIELPMYNWDMSPYSDIEFLRQYYSTLHWKKRINGYSGFSPKEWEERTGYFMLNFPDENTIDYLKDIGVKYLVLHQQEYRQLERDNFKINGEAVVKWGEVIEKLNKNNDATFIKQFGQDYVYGFTN